MKMHAIITMTVFFCILTAGCQEKKKEAVTDKDKVNHELVNSYNDIAVQNAIISQHTLFPYHFVNNGEELNELGDSDLNILAMHFLKHPGKLNIRRGNTPEELYQGRIDFVFGQLEQAGVENDQISVADGMPGGSGMLSEKVLTITEEKNDRISSYK